jgi:hypothetical protein
MSMPKPSNISVALSGRGGLILISSQNKSGFVKYARAVTEKKAPRPLRHNRSISGLKLTILFAKDSGGQFEFVVVTVLFRSLSYKNA